jgi:hypothetical protein
MGKVEGMKTFSRAGKILAVAAGCLMALGARGQTTAAASGPAQTVYSVSEANRFHFFFQQGRLVRLDVLTGEFTLMNQFDGKWNPVVIATRDAKSSDENSQNINFLTQTMSNASYARLNDPAKHSGRFHIISVYYNPDGTPMPPNFVPPDNATGNGASNQNFMNRLVRLDSVTGEFALMDPDSGMWVRVAIPVKEARPDVNADNVRLVGGLHL